MAKKRNTLRLDTSGFTEMLKKLDALGGDVKITVDEALKKAGDKIERDTEAAIAPANLPARGKYSHGDTKESIIHDAQVHWEGQVGWIPVGFDFSKPGAGGYLITGTPKMRPDLTLNRMYKQKKYIREIQEMMSDTVLQKIVDAMERGIK